MDHGEPMGDPARVTIRRRRLGRELRRIREELGWTQAKAAHRTRRQPSSLAKIERAEQGLTHDELIELLDAYGVTDRKLRRDLALLRRDANKKGWWLDFKGRIEPSLLDYVSLESDAKQIHGYDGLHLPGLLQTEDYARSIIASSMQVLVPTRVEELVTLRMTRQEIMSSPRPPEIRMVLDEAALHRPFGGPEIMRKQRTHLLELSESGKAAIRVLPFAAGAHPGHNGSFTLLNIGHNGDMAMVLVEGLTQSWYLEESEDVERYRLILGRLQNLALTESGSRAMIQRLQSEL